MSDYKISFFENIYYWIWYYIPKSKYSHHPPPALACTFLSVLKTLNFFWIIMFLSAVLKSNILKDFLGDEKVWLILGSLGIGYFLIRNDEKKYEQRFEVISKKIETLSMAQRNKKRIIFFVYIVLSIVIWSSAPTMVSFYN